MIEHFLKLRCRVESLACSQVGLAAYICRIEPTEFGEERSAGHREVVWQRGLQPFDRTRRILILEREKGAESGQILELHRCVLRESFGQVLRQPSRSQKIPSLRQRERRRVHDVAAISELE